LPTAKNVVSELALIYSGLPPAGGGEKEGEFIMTKILQNIFLFAIISQPILSFSLDYKEDSYLSDKMTQKYKDIIMQTRTGKEFYKRFMDKRGDKFPKIYLRNSDFQGLGWYEIGEDAIYFNTKYLMKFFDIKGYADSKIITVMNNNKKALSEFVYYTDTLYLHELIHCLQDTIYGKNRYMKEGGLFLEFEYEAFFISDMYFHEKMMKNKVLFKKILSNEYSDIYTDYDIAGYLMISMDPVEYKKNIEKRYKKEIYGYITLTEEKESRKNRLEEKKLLSYATGDKDDYKKDEIDYRKLSRQKEDYDSFLKNFFDAYWPKFSIEALEFIQDTAMDAKNYPLALDTIPYLEKKDSDLDKDKIERLKTKSALIILSAIAFIKDNQKKMPREILAQHLKFLEKACSRTGRSFPEELNDLRKNVYLKIIKKYLKLAASQKDEQEKEYYLQDVAFFSDSLEKNYSIISSTTLTSPTPGVGRSKVLFRVY